METLDPHFDLGVKRLVTWLVAYTAVVVVSAVVGGTWDQYRQKAKGTST